MKAREHLLDYIRARPGIFYRIMPFRRRYDNLLLDRDTDLVIEGYPRCANTFAVAAIQTSQPRPLKLARHTHAIAQICRAHKWGTPTLLLIRRPEDAVLSYVIREDAVDMALAIRRYIRFHQAAAALCHEFVVSDFETTTSDFARVIDTLNARYNLSLHPFKDTQQQRDAISREIEHMERIDAGGSLSELKVGRPSEERRQLKLQLQSELHNYGDQLSTARRLYEQLLEHSI